MRICDFCGKEIKTDKDFWKINVGDEKFESCKKCNDRLVKVLLIEIKEFKLKQKKVKC